MVRAKGETDTALSESMKDHKFARKLQGFVVAHDVDKQRTERLLGDEKLQGYIDDFDFDGAKVGVDYKAALKQKRDNKGKLSAISGARNRFLYTLFNERASGISNRELAAALGIDEGVAKATRLHHGEKIWAMVKQKAEAGDPRALNVYKAARAAQRDEATRIHGTITIKDGGDSKPADIEANLGGLAQ